MIAKVVWRRHCCVEMWGSGCYYGFHLALSCCVLCEKCCTDTYCRCFPEWTVKVSVKGRKVTVKGPRGTLSRDFGHLRLDVQLLENGTQLKTELWFGSRKSNACIRTVTSHIANMITGVTKGFLYKMRMVYAHFPIAVGVEDGGKKVAIRNFLGEKIVREVPMLEGVKVERSTDVKDEIVLSGNDINAVSQSG